jgi:hypothetical protein
MHLAAEDFGAPSRRQSMPPRCYRKTGKHPHHRQQHEPALPIIAKIFGQHYRDVTLFEMAPQQRESHQQTKQIDQNDPFVLKVSDEPHNAIASPKACEGDFYRSRLSPSR